MKERLQKIIRDVGLASRREAEQWILAGRVKLNGEIVTELGTQADLEQDDIEVNGRLIERKENKVYYLFHKPTEVVTTLKDPQQRRTVADYFSSIPERVFPVGRLDYDTEGLVIMTNDGDLMNGLIHPSKEIPKIYEAIVKGAVEEESVTKFENGLELSDGKTAPAKCKILKQMTDSGKTRLRLTIHEGRNRQVRRMLGAIGHPVVTLKRVGFSFLTLGRLESGKYRELTGEEVRKLKSLY